MLKSSLPRRVVWPKMFLGFSIWSGIVGIIFGALSILFTGNSNLNLGIKVSICLIALAAPILAYIIWINVSVILQRVKQYDLLYDILLNNQKLNEQKQVVVENNDIYLSVCLFRDIKTEEQKEQNRRTLIFYRDLQKKLESIWHITGGKVITRRDFYAEDAINPRKIPAYANEAFDKIVKCEYFITVIQKLPDEISGGSHLIEVGYALAKNKPVLCYIEETMYKPMFLREMNRLSHYRLITFSDENDLFLKLEAIEFDFDSIKFT